MHPLENPFEPNPLAGLVYGRLGFGTVNPMIDRVCKNMFIFKTNTIFILTCIWRSYTNIIENAHIYIFYHRQVPRSSLLIEGTIFSLFVYWFQPGLISQPTVFSSYNKLAPAELISLEINQRTGRLTRTYFYHNSTHRASSLSPWGSPSYIQQLYPTCSNVWTHFLFLKKIKK